MLAGNARMCPLTSLLCFFRPTPHMLPDPSCFLQEVSDQLAACHVVLVICPPCLVCDAGRLF